MTNLHPGIATFLMTDVVGSTMLWERHPAAMSYALQRHDTIIEEVVVSAGGSFLKHRGEGDSTFSVFSSPSEGILAAVNIQRRMIVERWPDETIISVRIGCHAGEAIFNGNDYWGTTVNRCARIRSLSNSGQILVSTALKNLVGEALPAEIKFRDLGVHRLKDLSQPERLFDVEDLLHQRSFPSLKSLTLLPNNLPDQPTLFVGRRRDVAALAQMVATDRLVTVIGPGGGGKTRLALHVAAEIVENFSGGVWLVELAKLPAGSSKEAISTAALKCLDGTGDMDLGAFARSLAHSPCLVVLDNCEHLIDGAREFVLSLLAASTRISVLATSRQPLGLHAERIFQIQPLELPKRGCRFEAAANSESVTLFMDRAQARNSEFRLTERNFESVADLVRAVDGLPLAIEFVASHVRALGPKQILANISDYLRTGLSDPSADVRHETMESAIRWSFESLDEAEQDAFRGVAVFPSGCNFESLKALGNGEQLRRAVISLVDKSMVLRQEDLDGEDRYRMLEPFRDFNENRYGPPDQTLRNAYSAYYREAMERISKEIEGDRQAESLEKLDAEIDNVRQALRWTEADSPELLGKFVYSIRNYWTRRGLIKEGADWHSRALLLSTKDDVQTAWICNSLGAFLWTQGRHDEAESCFSRAYSIGLVLGNLTLSASSKNNVAMLQAAAGRIDEARTSYLDNLQLFEATGELLVLGTTLSNLGDLEAGAGNYTEAVAYLERALVAFEETGNQAKLARAHFNLAMALRLESSFALSVSNLERSFDHWMRVTDPSFLGEGLHLLGCLGFAASEIEESLFFIFASQAVMRRCAAKLDRKDAAEQQTMLRYLRVQLPNARFESIKYEASTASEHLVIERARSHCRALWTRFSQKH